MKLTEQLINAIEDKIGIIIPRDGWDPEFDAVLEKIKGVEEDSDFLDCLNAAPTITILVSGINIHLNIP